MKTILTATLLAGAALNLTAYAEGDCIQVVERIKATAERSKVDPIELLRQVDKEVTAQPDCACEIVKAAIVGTDCDDAIVGYVVETAIQAAPEQMRLIAQCAIATAPQSLNRVQEVLARLEPAAGEATSAKSAKGKGPEVKPAAAPPNPLDLPPPPPPVPPLPPPPPPPVTETNFREIPD